MLPSSGEEQQHSCSLTDSALLCMVSLPLTGSLIVPGQPGVVVIKGSPRKTAGESRCSCTIEDRVVVGAYQQEVPGLGDSD